MQVDYCLRCVYGEIGLLATISGARRNQRTCRLSHRTWKESFIDRREGSGDASIAFSTCTYREGIAIRAALQRM